MQYGYYEQSSNSLLLGIPLLTVGPLRRTVRNLEKSRARNQNTSVETDSYSVVFKPVTENKSQVSRDPRKGTLNHTNGFEIVSSQAGSLGRTGHRQTNNRQVLIWVTRLKDLKQSQRMLRQFLLREITGTHRTYTPKQVGLDRYIFLV